MNKAVLYLRASTDRPGKSIDAQRRVLRDLAQAKGLVVVGEYADTVASSKDEERPGFQNLVLDLRSAERAWSHLLMLDTTRVARRRAIAILFEALECKKRNVKVIYKHLPDADPIIEMLLRSMLQSLDEWESLARYWPLCHQGRGIAND